MSIYYVGTIPYSDSLTHHGIKGQKWGIRRYQNPDGTLTPAGKERYRLEPYDMDYLEKRIVKRMDKAAKKADRYEDKAKNKSSGSLAAKYYSSLGRKYVNRLESGTAMLRSYRSLSVRERDYIRDDVVYRQFGLMSRQTISDLMKTADYRNSTKKEKRKMLSNLHKGMAYYG